MKQATLLKLTDFPEYNAALDRLNGLKAQLHDAEYWSSEQGALVREEADALVAKARALMETGSVPDDRESEELLARRKKAVHDRPVIRKAVELAAAEVERQRTICSRAVNEKARPAYRDLARRFAEAVANAAQLHHEMQATRDSLEGNGVVSSLPYIGLAAFQNLKAPESTVMACLVELAEAGFLDGQEPFLKSLKGHAMYEKLQRTAATPSA